MFLENIENNFILNILDEHKNTTDIEKYILSQSMLKKNYVCFEFFGTNVHELCEHLRTAKKYGLYYQLCKISSKGGGTYYKFTYVFPDIQTDDNIIQNFYFRHKKKLVNRQYNKILYKFTRNGNYHMANIDDLNMEDMMYIEENITKLENFDINGNIIKIKDKYIAINPTTTEYIHECPYQILIDQVASKLYYCILKNYNINKVKFDICELNRIQYTKIANLIEIMTNNTYTLALEQNFNYDEFYDTSDKIYVLKNV